MRFQAGIQIILLITAVVIVFTVIKPKFESISQTQVEVEAYKNAVDNIGQYNARLQQLLNQASSISAEDLSALYRYLPEEVDAVAVGRDINNIAIANNLLLVDVVPGEGEEVVTESGANASDAAMGPSLMGTDPSASDPLASGDTGAFVTSAPPTRSLSLSAQTFDVSVVGTYEDMKAMLQDIEMNDYPLRIKELSFEVSEEDSDLVEYSLVLETYSLSFK